MKPLLAVILISGFVLTASTAPVDSEEEDGLSGTQPRFRRSFRQLPAGLLEPILPLVKAIVPEPLLGKITMLLPLPAASDSSGQESS